MIALHGYSKLFTLHDVKSLDFSINNANLYRIMNSMIGSNVPEDIKSKMSNIMD